MPETEIRAMPYRDLVARVRGHHRARGEQVDFWLMKHGSIVGHYRVRASSGEEWRDLLPTGISGERYRSTIAGLGEILFPGDHVTVDAIERDDARVTVWVVPSALAS
ncbi:MAG: hypothetical protein FJ033_10090 [Chloroflexi bacterium]|nr:hypothetical protein [Chloroflexota bacterium]